MQGAYRGHRMQSWWPEERSFIWVGPCWTGGWRGVVLSLEAWIAYSYRVMRNLHNLTSAGAAFCGKSCSEGIEHRWAPPPAFWPSRNTLICVSISSFTQMSHDRGSLSSCPQTNKHVRQYSTHVCAGNLTMCGFKPNLFSFCPCFRIYCHCWWKPNISIIVKNSLEVKCVYHLIRFNK